MSAEKFNQKWRKYLKKGHYGLDISDKNVIATLDNIFEDLAKIKGFKFIQIKMKFILPILIISGILSGCAIVEQAQNDAIKTYEQTKDFVEQTTNQVQDNYTKTKTEFENTTKEVKERIEKTTEDVKKASAKIEETYQDVLKAQEEIQQAADAINNITN